MNYEKPRTTVANATLRASLLAGSGSTIIDDKPSADPVIIEDVCPLCGKSGGKHKGWCPNRRK